MPKEIERIVVPENEQQKWDDEAGEFVENVPSTFYILDALGQKVYYKTKSRADAQQACDEDYGKERYTIRASKDVKTKSKLESGGLSVTGTSTRRGQKKY